MDWGTSLQIPCDSQIPSQKASLLCTRMIFHHALRIQKTGHVLHQVILSSSDTLCYFLSQRESLTIAAELIKMANSKLKVFAINDRSTYSNVAFALLGYALERATGKAYSEILASSILQPLGMNYTRTTKPLDSMGVIPHMAHSWGSDLGADIPFVSFLDQTSCCN